MVHAKQMFIEKIVQCWQFNDLQVINNTLATSNLLTIY